MKSRQSVFDNEANEHFIRDVMKPLIPNARVGSTYFFGAAATIRASNIKIELPISNDVNLGSDYFYNKKYSFIHYTSVEAMLSILKSKKIRLYDLNSMDDKEEFKISLDILKKDYPSYLIKNLRDKVFCFSMVESRLENQKKSLPMWRSYGNDGMGVGIEFTFNKESSKDWINTMLSKIYYGEKHLERFRMTETLYNEFQTKFGLNIRNFDYLLYKYFGFHKNKIYDYENEVRLIYSEGFNSYNQPINVEYNLDKNNKRRAYYELDLEWELRPDLVDYCLNNGITVGDFRPKINISKIFLGYRLNNKHEITDTCNEMFKNYKRKPIIIDSPLVEHF